MLTMNYEGPGVAKDSNGRAEYGMHDNEREIKRDQTICSRGGRSIWHRRNKFYAEESFATKNTGDFPLRSWPVASTSR